MCVVAAREAPSVSVPAPDFTSRPSVGALTTAETPFDPIILEAVSVPPPAATVASARNTTEFAVAFAASVAEAFAVSNMALNKSFQSDGSPPSVQAPVSPQFVPVPFHTRLSSARENVKLAVLVS